MDDRRDLHAALEKLHAELHDARRVDPAERDLLVELMADIRRVLDEPALPEGERHRGLRDRLDRSIYDLQESHPQLVESVRHVVDYLSAMGI